MGVVLPRDARSVDGRGSNVSSTGHLNTTERLAAAQRTGRARITSSTRTRFDAEWFLSQDDGDFDGGPPYVINHDISGGRSGRWNVTAGANLTATSFPEQNGILRCYCGGFGDTVTGLFFTPSGGSFQVNANAGAASIEASAMTVRAEFQNSASLDDATGLLLTLFVSAHRIGS